MKAKVKQHWHLLAIGKVVEWTLLINNSDSSFLSADSNAFDVIRAFPEFLKFIVNNVSSLDGSLCMEFCRERYLEQDVLHDVRTIGNLELKRFTLESTVQKCDQCRTKSLRYTLNKTSQKPQVFAVSTEGSPFSPFLTINARLTAREQASPAAQAFLGPVLGA